jgi:hypothetical protein
MVIIGIYYLFPPCRNKLASSSRVILEKLIIVKSLKKFVTVYGTRGLNIILTRTLQ